MLMNKCKSNTGRWPHLELVINIFIQRTFYVLDELDFHHF